MRRAPRTPAQEDARLLRRAVARLKKEIGRIDRNSRRRYIREFLSEFDSFREEASFDDLLVDCLKSDLIYIGDYHALPASQRFAARLLREIAARSRRVVLGVEMVFGRHQRILDAWMAEEIGEDDFLRRIRYDSDWGYDWRAFRAVFEVAREFHCRVYGLDCEPRASFRFIRKRDRYAAARIVHLFARAGASKVVAVVGESHLASGHLPRRVTRGLRRARLEKRAVVVVQNMDEIYWRLARTGRPHADTVRVGRRKYCVFTAGLLEKYESYRQTIERWKKEHGEDDVDLTPTVYGVIDTILEFLGVDKYRHCLTRSRQCVEFMVDAYPEVYSGADAPLVRRLLRAQGMDAGDEEEVLSHLERKGSCFVPRLNAILIGEFSLVHVGEEAGHFVNMALKRQLYERAPRQAQRHDYFYASAMEEALAFFASKIIHPARNHFQESLYFRLHGKDPAAIERESGQTHAEFQEIMRFILLHKRLEQRYGDYERVPGEILRGIGADARRVRVLTHELGYYLGQQIYDGYQAGVISREEIAALFQARFDESGSALKAYLSLAEKLAGQVAGTPEPQA